jgi:RNA polymerase sigma-70 factor, ECF subfamily
MSDPSDRELQDLIEQSARGDHAASQRLLAKYRRRVRHMVAVRIDSRLAGRIDPSDVVQDAFIEAFKRLPKYLQAKPMPFYPWLRQIAWEQLVALHRHHLDVEKRSVRRETPQGMVLSDASAIQLAERVAGAESSPTGHAIRKERCQRVRRALEQLRPRDREVLILRFLEQLSIKEIASVLRTSDAGVQMRQARALERLRGLLDEDLGGQRQ